jgi:glutamate-ammonia-ligase adenylyltransferase
VADLLGRDPEGLRLLADDSELVPRTPEALRALLGAAVARYYDEPEAAVVAARALRRRELLRVACADLLGKVDTVQVGKALSDVTDAVLSAALKVATRSVVRARGWNALPATIAIIGMGRLGGGEMSYASDADVMFVHDPAPGVRDAEAAAAAAAVAEEMRRLLAAPAPDPPVGLDTTLRPEGRQGPPSRSLASYAEYYRRWSHIWEAQALLRARPVAGDVSLGERFLKLIYPIRYPADGITNTQVIEVRRIKARVDAERLPRGADPATHAKLGRGGLADVEWTVQLLQLQHAARVPELRTARTVAALEAALAAGLLDVRDAHVLVAAWRLATRVRNGMMVVRGRPSDSLSTDVRELASVARYMGYSPGNTGTLLESYRRATRRARATVERVFYA